MARPHLWRVIFFEKNKKCSRIELWRAMKASNGTRCLRARKHQLTRQLNSPKNAQNLKDKYAFLLYNLERYVH